MANKTCQLAQCQCKNGFQDQTYGQNERLHSLMNKSVKHDKQTADYKCSVCGKIKQLNTT